MNRYNRWTDEEQQRLQALIAMGKTYRDIAKELGRTYRGVAYKGKGVLTPKPKQQGFLSAYDIAHILGIRYVYIVTDWITTRGLQAVQHGTYPSLMYGVEWFDLYRWLECEDNWMCYDPQECTDPDLKQYLLEIQAGKPKWIQLRDAANDWCVTYHVACLWIKKGYITGVKYKNKWWVREDIVAAFVPPNERTQKGKRSSRIQQKHTRIKVAHAMRDAGYHLAFIANTLDISVATLQKFLHIPKQRLPSRLRKRLTSKDREELSELAIFMRSNGSTFPVIARTLNLSIIQVRHLLDR